MKINVKEFRQAEDKEKYIVRQILEASEIHPENYKNIENYLSEIDAYYYYDMQNDEEMMHRERLLETATEYFNEKLADRRSHERQEMK